MQYPIAIFQKNNSYNVIIPDIPELTATGSTMAEAVTNARLAVINHLHQLVEKDLEIPEPTPVSNQLIKPEYAGYTWAIVGIELARIIGESLEINLLVPARIINQLSQIHPEKDLNQVMIQAFKHYISKHKKEH